MKKIQLITLILVFLSLGTLLFAGGFALSGIGSRAISMGGAFRGMADDGTAMYWNPAGLGFISNNSVTLAGAGIYPASSFDYAGTQAGLTTSEIEATKKLWLFPNIFAVKGGDCKLHYGLGVYVPYGLGAEWDAYNLPTTMPVPDGAGGYVMAPITWGTTGTDGNQYPLEEKESYSSIGIVDVHPTVSYRILENLSAGLGISVNYGMITIKALKPTRTSLTAPPSYYVPTYMELEGTGIGYGANLGFMYRPMENLSIGLTGKLPSEIKMSGDLKLRTYLNNLVAGSMGIPSAVVSPFDTDVDATLKLPGDIGFGVSYAVKENWKVNADFTYTMWDVLDKVVVEFKDTYTTSLGPVTEEEMLMNWDNTMRVSLGTEYWLGSNGLRGGFFYDQSPIPDETLSPTWPDVNDKFSGNIGYSKKYGPFQFDINFEHIYFTERDVTEQDPMFENQAGLYNTSVNAFNLGLTYNF
jgi:long-chain fatty acid transport protein